ncbi:unnamed protein product, partial [Ixodes pacificus]
DRQATHVEDVAEREGRGDAEHEHEQVGHVAAEPAEGGGPLGQQLPEVGQLGVVEGRVALAAKRLPDGVEVAHQHRLLVREGVEAVLSVVAPHAARPHSAKGERRKLTRQVDKGVVGAHASAGRLLHEAVDHLLGLGKHVQLKSCPSASPLVDELNRLVRTLHPQDRQHRTEDLAGKTKPSTDLFLHDGVRGLDVGEQGGRDVLGVLVHLATHGRSGAIQQLGYSPARTQQSQQPRRHSLDVVGVDDASQVWAGLGVLRVELCDDPLAGVHKVRVGRLVAQHVVRRHAGLAGVDVLAPHEAPAGHLHVQALVQVHRAARGRESNLSPFPTKLERDGSQVLLCGLVDDLADVDGARVEDVVKLLGEQLRALLGAPSHHGEKSSSGTHRIKVLRDELLDDLGRGSRVLRRLDHRTVSRRNGSDQRAEGQLQRVVPGPDDQSHAVRLAVHQRLVHYQHDMYLLTANRATYLFGFHPFLKLHDGAFDLISGEVDLKQDALKLPTTRLPHLVQVLFEGLHERVVIVDEKPVQSLELLDPVARRPRLAQLERAPKLNETKPIHTHLAVLRRHVRAKIGSY